MIKIKIDNQIIKFNEKKKKNLARPTNQDNQGCLTKLPNRVIDTTKFISLVFLNHFLFN